MKTKTPAPPFQDFLISLDRVLIFSVTFLGIGLFLGWVTSLVLLESAFSATQKAGAVLPGAGAVGAIYMGNRCLRTPRLQLRLTPTGIEYKKIVGNYANYKTNVGIDFYWIRQFCFMPYDAIADVAVEKRGWQCLICVTNKAQQKKYFPFRLIIARKWRKWWRRLRRAWEKSDKAYSPAELNPAAEKDFCMPLCCSIKIYNYFVAQQTKHNPFL